MIEDVIAAARAAGELIQRVRESGFLTEQKDDAGPVTRADREADALLKKRLLDLYAIGWLSEETADDRTRLQQSELWVVDPLDGTREFVQGLPEYTVAIALVEAGEPALAVVHNPATRATFWAERGAGAFQGGDPIRVREGRTLLASRSETNRGEFEPFEPDWEVVPVGSIEYKLARVAAGEGAVTLSRGPKHEWDVCAGALLVAEAGGVITDLFGERLRYNQPFPKTRGVLAGAPGAHATARSRIGQIGASDRMSEFYAIG